MRNVADLACENDMSTADVAEYIKSNYRIDISVSQIKKRFLKMGLLLISVDHLVQSADGPVVQHNEKWRFPGQE